LLHIRHSALVNYSETFERKQQAKKEHMSSRRIYRCVAKSIGHAKQSVSVRNKTEASVKVSHEGGQQEGVTSATCSADVVLEAAAAPSEDTGAISRSGSRFTLGRDSFSRDSFPSAGSAVEGLRRQRSQLDTICWWLFPLSYGCFCVIMVAMWKDYDHHDRCQYTGFKLNSTNPYRDY
jgi:hypothetical protein